MQDDHPRPDLRRDAWLSLDGPWRFAFDPKNRGEHERWYAGGGSFPLTIQVPYPWESKLSGLEAVDYQGAGWYQREVTAPAAWQGQRVFLHLGAVDWSCRVWLDGRLVGEQENGYLPLSIDVTDHLAPGQSATLTVRAFDVADAHTLLGKQVPRWYTYSSGIWQPVWLEPRPASHVASLRIDASGSGRIAVRVSVTIAVSGEHTLRLSSPNDAVAFAERRLPLPPGTHEVTLSLDVPEPRRWSPDDPHLYDLDMSLNDDTVQSYFGLRDVGRGAWDGRDYEYVLLNDEPIYLRGALDQAFHPDGVYAYPSGEAIRVDIQLAKELGLNMLRCQIKINDPRYYYWADRLGAAFSSSTTSRTR